MKPRPATSTDERDEHADAELASAATISAAASGALRPTTPAPISSARPVSSSARV